MTLFSAPYDIYFWEPSLSPHKLDLVREVARRTEVDKVWYISQQGLLAERSEQGWSVDIGGGGSDRVIISPSPDMVRSLVENSPETSIHIFSGTHHVPSIVEGLRRVIAAGRRFAIMSEPRASEGLAGFARYLHSLASERGLRRHVGFVLAIGQNGPDWFRRVGYPAERVFPFAYFLRAPHAEAGPPAVANGPLRVAWIARLVESKGLTYFLDAVGQVRRSVSVRIIGVGPMADRVRDACRSATVPMEYLGTVPMADISQYLAETDVLILPSITTNDGWGAVVSEALMAGTAVITTPKAGASVCIRNPDFGEVVPARSAGALASAIEHIQVTAGTHPAARAKRRDWALTHLTDEAGARHLVEIINHIYCGGQRPPPFFET